MKNRPTFSSTRTTRWTGIRGARRRFEKARRGEQADLSLGRLFDLPLVPRDGARIVRECGDREAHERAFREHQSRSRGAARRGSRLHDLRAGDDRRRRLADERLPHAGPQAVSWRHLFSARGSLRPARFPDGAQADRGGLEEGSREHRRARRRRSSSSFSNTPAPSAATAAKLGTEALDQLPAISSTQHFRRRTRRLRRRAEISAPRRAQLSLPHVTPAKARDIARRQSRARRWRCSRCAKWPTAACTITSAAASIATRWTSSGTSRTSRRCSTIRRSSPARISTRSRSRATREFEAVARDILDYVRRDMTARTAASTPPRMRTACSSTANPSTPRARSTSGRRRRSSNVLGEDAAAIFNRVYGVEADGNAPRGQRSARTNSRARTRSSSG